MTAPSDSLSQGLERLLPTYARADLTIVRGEGARVWDSDGREYLDFGGGIAVVALGHCHPAPLAAAQEQLARLWHASNLYRTEPAEGSRSGSPSASAARRRSSATRAPSRSRRRSSTRGRRPASPASSRSTGASTAERSGALSATGQPAKREAFEPLVPGVRFVRPNDVDALVDAVDDEVGLILLEPILGEGGVIPLDGEFVSAAAALPPLLGFDEVQTGVGRTGTFFAFEQLDVRPDLVTLAKGLANGLPIGALLVAEEARGGFAPGDHGSTFGGNPVSCAAACAVVDAIDGDLLDNIRKHGATLADGLAALPGVLEVRGRGLLLGAVVDRPANDVVVACRERGLLVLTAGDDVVRLAPPLTIGPEDVEEALAILASALGAESPDAK